MKRTWSYLSGEAILKGDVVKFGSWDAIVVAVVSKGNPDYVDYIGEGIDLEGPAFGRLHAEFINEDLVLVRRKQQ